MKNNNKLKISKYNKIKSIDYINYNAYFIKNARNLLKTKFMDNMIIMINNLQN